MKLKCFVLLIFLGVCGLSLAVSSITESEVESYSVTRRLNDPDLFTVKMKDGQVCALDGEVHIWCNSLSAYRHKSSWHNRSSCSCTCDSSFTIFFLPALQTCINVSVADNFGGCSGYFEKWLNRQVNLGVDKALDFKEPSAYHCYIVSGHYFDYQGFHTKWESILDQIFSFNSSRGKLKFQWRAVNAGKLSGRIIRLRVTCNYRGPVSQDTKCMLFMAVGSVTYYSSTRPVVQPTVVASSPLPSAPFMTSLPPQSSTLVLPLSKSLSSSSSSSSSSSLSSSSSSSSSSSLLPLTASLSLPFTASPTGILSVFPSTHSPSRLTKNAPVLSTSRTELQSSLSFHSEKASSQVFSTRIPNPIISTVAPHPVEPSKSSSSTEVSYSAGVIDGPGNKRARTSGNNNGTVIGAAVGGAVVFGIFVIMIIIFCKRRKLREGKEKPKKLQAKNPVYGSSDIPMSSATQNPVSISMDQDSEPTYQGLVTDNGKISGAAIYSSADDNDYDNYNAYQSLDKKVPGSPVYQSLTKGPLDTGQPTPRSKPHVTGPPGDRPKVTAEPVYNVIEQPDTEQGTMPEKASRDSDEHTQSEPVYNVLDGSDSEENYEAGDSLYNVLEEPESIQDQQQPLYNVLENSDAEKSSHQGAQGSCGLSNEPLYNVVEGPDSDGPNEIGVGYDGPSGSTSSDGHDNPTYEESLNFGPTESGVGSAAPNGSSSPDAHDNPAYEKSLDFDVPYASVQRPGSQRESVYEPLRERNDQDLYEPVK